MTHLHLSTLFSIACALGVASCIPEDPPSAQPPPATPGVVAKKCAAALIDDCEDGDNRIAMVKGRGGYWYTFADTAGTVIDPLHGSPFKMAAGGANGSTRSAHMKGKVSDAAIVFAGMGLDLTAPKTTYDAHAYQGVSFWAKTGPNVSTTKLRLKIPDVATDPVGKICSECFNDFGADLELTPNWTQYTFPWNQMKQIPGWGHPKPTGIDASKIYAIQFQVNTQEAVYDVWVDDVEFIGGCP